MFVFVCMCLYFCYVFVYFMHLFAFFVYVFADGSFIVKEKPSRALVVGATRDHLSVKEGTGKVPKEDTIKTNKIQ